MNRFVLTLTALLLGSLSAAAQDWPSKPVKIVVPFGAGSTPDVVARLIADHLQKKLGQTFLIDNKPGASGNIGTDAVAKAAPDGTTIGVSIGGPLAINALLFSKLPYDPKTDLTPITQLVTQPSALAVNSSVMVNNVNELVALLKREPGKYGERFAVETARTLIAPEPACGVTEIAGRQPICTSLRMIAVIAAGEEA